MRSPAAILAAAYGARGRVLRFAGVGATGVPVDVSVTLLAVGLIGLLPAQVAGWLVAASWNWHWNRCLTWRSDDPWLREWAQYLGVDAGRLSLRIAIVAVASHLGAGTIVATGAGIAAATGIGFLGFDRLVFGEARGTSDAATEVSNS